MNVVIETNVAIAANGRDTHASLECQYACIELIESITSKKSKTTILVDDHGLIISEYSKHLNHKGQPGVGDAFYKYLHNHMYLEEKIAIIPITPNALETTGFDELPENNIDKSDRKFLAVALCGNGTLINALDSDWHEQAKFISDIGVEVKQLCPDHSCFPQG